LQPSGVLSTRAGGRRVFPRALPCSSRRTCRAAAGPARCWAAAPAPGPRASRTGRPSGTLPIVPILRRASSRSGCRPDCEGSMGAVKQTSPRVLAIPAGSSV
jgi:hypothetical protein